MWFLHVGIECSREVRGAKLIEYLESRRMALKVFVWLVVQALVSNLYRALRQNK